MRTPLFRPGSDIDAHPLLKRSDLAMADRLPPLIAGAIAIASNFMRTLLHENSMSLLPVVARKHLISI